MAGLKSFIGYIKNYKQNLELLLFCFAHLNSRKNAHQV